MTLALVFLGLLFTATTFARADQPRLVDSWNGVRGVDLGRSVATALATTDPAFRMFEVNDMADQVVQLIDPHDQPPFATIGDFNGDGRPDVIVMGVSHDELKIYGVLSNGDGYDVHLIRRGQFDTDGVNLVLTLVENERRRPKNEDRSIHRFDVDAFHVGTADSNPVLMHFVDGKFVRETR